MVKLITRLARASSEALACIVRGHWEGALCELFLEGGIVIPALVLGIGYWLGKM